MKKFNNKKYFFSHTQLCRQHIKKKYFFKKKSTTNLNILTFAVLHARFMTLRKKNVVVTMMMRNQEIDKRRKFSQPNSLSNDCDQRWKPSPKNRDIQRKINSKEKNGFHLWLWCPNFYCFHFSFSLASSFRSWLEHSFPISYSQHTA